MCIYLVDYENVNYTGIDGINELGTEDIVYIFYNEQIKTMPFSAAINLAAAKARTEFIRIKKTGKNYLDFQLATLLGYFIGKDESVKAVIISNDMGFDSVVDFWKSKNADVCRKSSIANEKAVENPADTKQEKEKAVPAQKEKKAKKQKTKVTADKNTVNTKSASTADFTEEYRKKLRDAVKGEEIAAKSYTLIYKAIVESKDKAKLNTALVKSFGSEKGNRIYRLIKKIFDEFRKSTLA